MAVLSDSDRAAIRAEFSAELSGIREACGLTKPDILAAAHALDQFLADNAAAVNAAIPQPARSGLTTPQKARLLRLVITKRYVKGA